MVKYIISLLIICTSLLVAEITDTTKSKIYPLDPVVITATKTEIARSLATPSISVISSDVLREERQQSVMSLISQRIPGVHVAERGIMGFGVSTQAGSISIRGVGGSPTTGVLVMIDGRPQYMGLFGHPLPDSYLMSSAERIEIIRGPASMLYGSNAMGGVINIITRHPTQTGVEGDASASYGSYQTMQANANVRYSNESYSSVVSISKERTNGERFSSKFDITSGYAKAGMKLNEIFSFSLDGSYSASNAYDPGTTANPRLDTNVYDINRGYVGIGIENTFSTADGSARIIYNFGKHTIFDGFLSNDFCMAGMVYENFHLFDKNIITAGIDLQKYGGDAKNTKTNFNFGNFSQNQLGVYTNIRQSFSFPVTVNAGVRLQHSGQFGDEVIPQAGIAYHAADHTVLRASTAKGFRAPTIRELYLFPAPTPTLKPEEMWNYEAGITQVVNNTTSLDLTIFQSDGSNMIQMIGFPPNAVLRNSGSFKFRGIELTTQTIINDHLHGEVNYGYTDVGLLTQSMPQHKIFISSTYLFSGFFCTLSMQHVSKIYGSNNSVNRMPDYTLLSARVSTGVLHNIRMYVSGENLLNKEYQIIYQYPMPGRTFFAGADISL